jgi:hypothetical protein
MNTPNYLIIKGVKFAKQKLGKKNYCYLEYDKDKKQINVKQYNEDKVLVSISAPDLGKQFDTKDTAKKQTSVKEKYSMSAVDSGVGLIASQTPPVHGLKIETPGTTVDENGNVSVGIMIEKPEKTPEPEPKPEKTDAKGSVVDIEDDSDSPNPGSVGGQGGGSGL